MIFNSLEFALFLPIVFGLYWFVFNRSLKQQNLLIFVASYVFYGWWDWRFLFLIFISTWIDYTIGGLLAEQADSRRRKQLLAISLVANLGMLFAFKYYNFFADSFNAAFTFFGSPLTLGSLQVVLPVGISFYTFQTLSYTIDVYKGTLKPSRRFVDFAAFVSFFPQLVAGPIERASNLLPQVTTPRYFDEHQARDDMRQILWGLFKKMVIADNCATYANEIFNHAGAQSGSTLVLGALFFTFQIYGDFSGYSDIAIGTAKLFGFKLMKNFSYPYFSRDVAEFWRRWHISLSTWFRDYVYIPMGGNRRGLKRTLINTVVLFLVSGLWHGANWTFVVWGGLNALFILPLVITGKNRGNLEIVAKGSTWPTGRELLSMLGTFLLVVMTWVFFRAQSIGHALRYFGGMLDWSLFSVPDIDGLGLWTLLAIGVMLALEWRGREHDYPLATLGMGWPAILRWPVYYAFIAMIVFLGGRAQEFIYFQF